MKPREESVVGLDRDLAVVGSSCERQELRQYCEPKTR